MKRYTTRFLFVIILLFGLSCLLSYLCTNEPESNAFILRAPFVFYRQFQSDDNFINHGLNGNNLLWNIILTAFVSSVLVKSMNSHKMKVQYNIMPFSDIAKLMFSRFEHAKANDSKLDNSH